MLLNCGVGEDSWESLGLRGDPTRPSWRRSVLGVHWKDWCWSWNSNLWPPDSWLIGKDPDAGKDWAQEEKGTTEDEMVGWHHRLNGHGFGLTLGVGDGQGGLACCSSWGHKVSDTAERLNWTEPWTSLGLCFHVDEMRVFTTAYFLLSIKYDDICESTWLMSKAKAKKMCVPL